MFDIANNIHKLEHSAEIVQTWNSAVREYKTAILLTEIGSEMHHILINLIAPLKAPDILFAEAILGSGQYFNLHPLHVAESYKSGKHKQKLGVITLSH